MFQRLDAYLIHQYQRGYLWALDRFGLYVGTFLSGAMAACVTAEFCWERGPSWVIIGLSVLLFGGLSQVYWYRQHSYSPELYNAHAASSREHWGLRSGLLVCWALGVLPLSAVAGSITEVAAALVGATGYLSFSYLTCVFIRPREPKKLFEREEALVPEASGA